MGDKTKHGWTAERIETLRRLWMLGYSGSQIAKELGGVTRNAVIGKAHRLGLMGHPKGRSETKAKVVTPKPIKRPPTPKPKPTPKPSVDMTGTHAPLCVSIDDLGRFDCRFVCAEEPALYCGVAAEPGMSWCAHHVTVVFTRPPPKSKPIEPRTPKREQWSW